MEAKTDYQKKMEELISALPETERPRLLMHSCCAPCTSAVLERVVPRFDVTLLYFNPNIMPRSEYERRAAEYPKLLRAAGLESAVDIIYCDYDDSVYLAAVKGLDNEPEGGSRCTVCYGLRLSETAKRAAEGGFDYFCTTLTVSPHKDARRINDIGAALSERTGVKWLWSDFKKRDGYLRSIRLSQEYGLYRQNYCGCVFSHAPET